MKMKDDEEISKCQQKNLSKPKKFIKELSQNISMYIIVREIYFRDLLKKIIKKNGERIYEENDQ